MDVYIGVYLEIEAEQIERLGPKTCPDGHRGSGSLWDSHFCSTCGKKMVQGLVKCGAYLHDLTDREDLFELTMHDDKVLDGKILAVGNLSKPLTDHVEDTDAPFIAKVTPEMEAAYMANFQINYQDIIAILAEKARVTIKFGVVGYEW